MKKLLLILVILLSITGQAQKKAAKKTVKVPTYTSEITQEIVDDFRTESNDDCFVITKVLIYHNQNGTKTPISVEYQSAQWAYRSEVKEVCKDEKFYANLAKAETRNKLVGFNQLKDQYGDNN